MPTKTPEQTEAALTVQEMARRSGVSGHTLRYYERIGLLGPVPRDSSSGHRRYPPEAASLIETLGYLRGTGMPLDSIRRYLALSRRGADAAAEQKALFAAHAAALACEMERMEMRMKYLAGKVAYWGAVEAGDAAGAAAIGEANVSMIKLLADHKKTR